MADNSLMVKKRRKKSKKIKWLEKLMISALFAYYAYSVFAFYDMTRDHYDVLDDRTKTNISSVWLDDVPFHQPFSGEKFVGMRLYLTNPDNVSDGVISVNFGNQETGEVLFTYEILVTEISDTAFDDYIEIFPDGVDFDDETVYFVEIDAYACMAKTIKTYLCSADSYRVYHSGDERDFESKMLYLDIVQDTHPFTFILWIFFTSLMIMLVIYTFLTIDNSEDNCYGFKIPATKESRLLIPVLITLGIIGTGILSWDKLTTHIVDYKDEALQSGYVLLEHSNYEQDFKVTRNNLREIHVGLDCFFENVGTFVVSIQKDDEEVVASVQNDELEFDGAYLIWDVGDIGLKKGEEYSLFVYTGFIEDDQECPIIKKIKYVYK